jgi:glucan 1,3-beta-glucosidase
MRFTSIITFALSFAGLIQALPIETRSVSSLYGVSYTPRQSDGSCQSASQIAASVKQMKASGVRSIRTYAQQCNQLPAILNAIKANGGGMTVLAAVWLDGSSADATEISSLKSTLASVDTSAISGILVGNEVVFNRIMSSSTLVQNINTVKAFAKGIKVGTAEVDSTYSQDLVAASDMVSVNIHPYFASVSINDAYSNLQQRYAAVKNSANGKFTQITESGWPSAGSPGRFFFFY